ncbi:MAG TPA: ABC transporter substrate-binding protein [Patescibacteria group bacterium]|nr:ABC transporter substrate-binding protein [Patescibacteria group bacterium]
MIDRTTRLRWRRRLRRSKRQVEDIGYQAEENLERHLLKRLGRLPSVLRFTTAWVLLLVFLLTGVVLQTRALDNSYLSLGPASGGNYTEGILGSFTNANPLYATSDVDSSVSHLVFAGLLKYNQQNKLVGDLATGWQVDARGVTYTVHLRDNLTWQDGQPLTSADVVFTYKLIQNPDAQSPLAPSWQGISVTAPDAHTVVFTLPTALTAFPNSITNGIVPKHLLATTPPAELRSDSFNTLKPVGAGPFKWQAIEVNGQTPETREEHIALLPNDVYWAGKPRLGKFIVRSFHDEKALLSSFRNQELNGVVGLTSMPADLKRDNNVHEYDVPLQGEVMVFLKNSSDILNDVKVRQALTMATDTGKIVAGLGYPAIVAREPLLASQLGYDKTLNQLSYNVQAAKQLLDSDGWVAGANGLRSKNGHILTFTLYSQENADYRYITDQLQKEWRAVGVQPRVFLQSGSDLQTTLSLHSYDALVYGIEIGNDPDVFAYWDSSQADIRSPNRLNFSEYKSPVADGALEAGRTRSDPALRIIKYKPFLQAWHDDAPAIALYQPRFLYVVRGQLYNFAPTTFNTGTDRYANVDEWMIRQTKDLK